MSSHYNYISLQLNKLNFSMLIVINNLLAVGKMLSQTVLTRTKFLIINLITNA